ncbi:MAG: hypothetical protein ACRCUC_07145 [Aestuariivirga sp.]
MDINSGRLMSLAAALRGELPPGIEEVPAELRVAARLALDRPSPPDRARGDPCVNLRSNHPLATWARAKRAEKRKEKIAAKSRRRNRK